MIALEWLGNRLSDGMGVFHPFGGAVDIIIVEQPDGSFKSSPWYVQFGTFQGVLKTTEKIVNITVNGVEADFHMHLSHKGEAYFLKEVEVQEEESVPCPLSSGDETGKQPQEYRLPLKSKSCDFGGNNLDSLSRVDLSNEKIIPITNSRRSRIFGFVFGRKSMKECEIRDGSGSCVEMTGSLNCAEIAADLLETNWCPEVTVDQIKEDSDLLVSASAPSSVEPNGDVKIDSEQSSLSSLIVEDIENHRIDNVSNNTAHCKQNDESLQFTSDDLDGSVKDDCAECSHEHAVATSVVVVKNVNDDICLVSRKTDEYIIGNADCGNANPVGSASKNANPELQISCLTLPKASPSRQFDGPNAIEEKDITPVSHVTDEVNQEVMLQCSCQALEVTPISSLAEEVKPQIISFVSNSSDPSHQGQDNQVSYNSEEEQFVFSDQDESKLHSAFCRGSLHLDFTDDKSHPISSPRDPVDGNASRFSNDLESSTIMSKIVSNLVNIPASCESTSEQSFLHAKSLPNMSLHMEDLNANSRHSLSHSMDRDPKTKWVLVREKVPFLKQNVAECSYSVDSGQSNNEDTQSLMEQNAEKAVHGPKLVKKTLQTKTPTSEQLATLKSKKEMNFKEGMNLVTFTFSTSMLGKKQVDARIYLWKSNTRIVISDVDGTITRSDVLGQFMPLVGMDWSQTGVANLFSAIKENGYQLLFLSARSISQAYLTRQFLLNLKQDGKPLPDGPVVISPDGLFPSLYREVIRRVPHEFKIACLEGIKELFPSGYSPFYAGFGNRDTDEISYLKVGIPRGKIFIINPRGEVALSRCVETKSYTSLHALVNGVFPPISSDEQLQEDYNEWNYWKLPPPAIDV